jgi:hypothetical protein
MRRVVLNPSTVLQRRLVARVEDHVRADPAADGEDER